MESTKQLCDDKRAAYHTWHALKLQYEQQVLGHGGCPAGGPPDGSYHGTGTLH